jgi:hypothetical protein
LTRVTDVAEKLPHYHGAFGVPNAFCEVAFHPLNAFVAVSTSQFIAVQVLGS